MKSLSISAENESPTLSLRANFSWTFAGNVIYAGCQWAILVILAKLGSPEMVGQFALGLTITAPVIMFTNLQLRAIQATDAKGEYLFSDYFGLRLITTMLALLVVAGITFVLGYNWQVSLVILAIGVAKAFESISDIFYGLLQQYERMDRIAKSMIIKGITSLAALGIVIFLTGNLFAGSVALAIAWAFILVKYDMRSGPALLKKSLIYNLPNAHFNDLERIRPQWNATKILKLIVLALPLGFVMLLLSLNSSIPRYFVEQILGERDLGIFAAIVYLQTTGSTVVGALGQSASPRMSKYYAVGDRSAFSVLLAKLLGIATLLGVAGVVAAIVAGRPILALLYRPEYAKQDVFVWSMIASGFSYVASFLGYGITAARYFKVQLPLLLGTTIALVVACNWLIPSNGLVGAAIALTLASIVQMVGSLAVIGYALFAPHTQTDEE